MSRLAILGGEPIAPPGAFYPWPPVRSEVRRRIESVLSSGILWGQTGVQLQDFERRWSVFVGVPYTLCFSSGTAALHAVLGAIGVGPGKEVIVSALGYPTTATAVLNQNGIPIFADVSSASFGLSPDSVQRRLSSRTAAIVATHYMGLPAEMGALREIADKHKIPLIEDACQAHGARYLGRTVGAIGTAGVFSFNATKNLPGIEGGAITTSSPELFQEARVMRGPDIGVPGTTRSQCGSQLWGWGYRPNELCLAFANAYLEELPTLNAARQENCRYLSHRLSAFPGIEIPKIPAGHEHVYYLFPVLFSPDKLGLDIAPGPFRQLVERAISAEGIWMGRWQQHQIFDSDLFRHRIGYGDGCPWRCHAQVGAAMPAERYAPSEFPVAEDYLTRHSVLWNVAPPNQEPQMDLIVSAFDKVWGNMRDLLSNRDASAQAQT